MLYIYDKQKKSLMPCKETEFRNHVLLERKRLLKRTEGVVQILHFGESAGQVVVEHGIFRIFGDPVFEGFPGPRQVSGHAVAHAEVVHEDTPLVPDQRRLLFLQSERLAMHGRSTWSLGVAC